MIATARQTKMILPGEVARCVMLDIKGVRSELPGHDEDDVLALIEQTGSLPWAWNIAPRVGPGIAREIRVLKSCVKTYAETGKRLKLQWRDALDEIFFGCNKPFLTGKEVKLVLNCSPSTVSNLLKATEIKPLPGTNWTTGPKGSALISCESFTDFLLRRFIIKPPEMESC
jgi:hypothetical protein